MVSRPLLLCSVIVFAGCGSSDRSSNPTDVDAGDAATSVEDRDATGSQDPSDRDASGSVPDASTGGATGSGGSSGAGGNSSTGGTPSSGGNQGTDASTDMDGDIGSGGNGTLTDSGVSVEAGNVDASGDAGGPSITGPCRGCLVEACAAARVACANDRTCAACLSAETLTRACLANSLFTALSDCICSGFCSTSCADLCQ